MRSSVLKLSLPTDSRLTNRKFEKRKNSVEICWIATFGVNSLADGWTTVTHAMELALLKQSTRAKN